MPTWSVRVSAPPTTDGFVRQTSIDVDADSRAELPRRIEEVAPAAWRDRFGEDLPPDSTFNFDPDT